MIILMYHSIADTEASNRYAVSMARFTAQMAWLRHSGWQGTSVAAALREHSNNQRRTVALTFDDGYADFLENAFPVLSGHGFSATVFLPTRYVGGVNGWETVAHKPLLTWAQVSDLSAAGIEFGSHTVSHLDLRRVSEDAVREELLQSRREISRHTTTDVVSFAYPYGYYRGEVPGLLREAGYRHGLLAATYGSNTAATPPYQLRRVPIWNTDSLTQFAAKARGWYRWRYHTTRAAQEVRWHLQQLHGGLHAGR